MLQEAFGDNAMSQSKTFLWYKCFKDGRTSVNDDERSGPPSTSTTPENIVKVHLISNIVTGDETWVYGYDPETKQQSSQWKSPNSARLKKARQVCSNVKPMLIVFSDIQGIVHKEFVPPGQTVNGKFYCDVLNWLREGIQHKRPDKW